MIEDVSVRCNSNITDDLKASQVSYMTLLGLPNPRVSETSFLAAVTSLSVSLKVIAMLFTDAGEDGRIQIYYDTSIL